MFRRSRQAIYSEPLAKASCLRDRNSIPTLMPQDRVALEALEMSSHKLTRNGKGSKLPECFRQVANLAPPI